MSEQLEVVRKLAGKAQAAGFGELKAVLVALIVAIIKWMEQQEKKDG